MSNNKTVFQRLSGLFSGVNNPKSINVVRNNYTIPRNNDILYSTDSKEERDTKLAQLKQQKMLAYQWAKTGYDTSLEQTVGISHIRAMYRDADLMDAFPEIGAALDIVAEESTCLNKDKKMVNIYSSSKRVKSVLEDLLYNRLDVNIILPMVARSLAKYGNNFRMLNIDQKAGVLGWREMPVHEMQRLENGMITATANVKLKPNEVKFVWEGHNESIPFHSWQMAHFRLIKDSVFLPYGCSWLNKARRHWRMLSMMEDAMLLNRLERSVERRIFKVNVGAIDDADVPAFLNEFMNNVKRAPIIDPHTGQIDLRKNFLDVSADYVIPVRSNQDPTEISTLQGTQSQTSMDDIEYMENKILSALRVPKTFLNFQAAEGKGQNLSIMDVRFCRTINTIQQAILMELVKICIIHLKLTGFDDDLTNFTLTMNDPSNYLLNIELDNKTKMITVAAQAVTDNGNGLPLMSWHQTQKEIMGKTDEEIKKLLSELRLEASLAMELKRTPEIIKRTGLFDTVDRIYGEPDAEYSETPSGEEGEGAGGLGGGMPDMGGGMFDEDFGDMEEEPDLGGDAQSEDASVLSEYVNGKKSPVKDMVDKTKMLTESFNNILKNLDTEINSIGSAQNENTVITD